MSNVPLLYPIVLIPAYQDYLWGGSKIIEMFNRKVNFAICAESWEASDRIEGQSKILEGLFKGRTLKDLLRQVPHFFSPNKLEKFPLLTKLIDANQSLSIQVHPNDQKAALYGGDAKSEMWYIIDAEENSKIYLGLKKNLTAIEIREAIAHNALENWMNAISVSKGDSFYIPAGLFHAIGKGCLIYEVQQNSNTTYRLYDWDRKDHNGQPRPLHIDEALSVMLDDQIYQRVEKSKQPSNTIAIDEVETLIESPYFKFNRLLLSSMFNVEKRDSFTIYFVLEGLLKVQTPTSELFLTKGQSFIIPASSKNTVLRALSAKVILLETIPNIRLANNEKLLLSSQQK